MGKVGKGILSLFMYTITWVVGELPQAKYLKGLYFQKGEGVGSAIWKRFLRFLAPTFLLDEYLAETTLRK